ncbi:hypothetical protein ACGFNU_00025 [Spirillospora sp. NPDC048911]|uniref:hypothetical protein n=1 Tax=Spirillospora sp. NPDC048911 TaxID=3364527 RepID=UPI00371AB5E1
MSFDRHHNSETPSLTPQQRAEVLRQKHRGTWMVLWSIYEKCFIVYPVWFGSGGCTVRGADETELERKMTETRQADQPLSLNLEGHTFYGRQA